MSGNQQLSSGREREGRNQPVGDTDIEVDWEDFIVHVADIYNSFNKRKMTSEFTLSKHRFGKQGAKYASNSNQHDSPKGSSREITYQTPQFQPATTKSGEKKKIILLQECSASQIPWSWKQAKVARTEREQSGKKKQQVKFAADVVEISHNQSISERHTSPIKEIIEEEKEFGSPYEEEEDLVRPPIEEWNEDPLDLYCQPEDGGEDPMIWSKRKNIGPFSYVAEHVMKTSNSNYAPPPTYETYQQLFRPTILKKDDLLEGLHIQDKGGLKCVDHRILNKQKGIVKNVISQAASNVFSGQSIIGISLPVRIFEPRSLLERITDWYSFGPVFLKEAAVKKDPVEKFKRVICFALAGLCCTLKQQKPFNPILGETFQAYYKDGTHIYAEHTSHHPPIANFLMEDSDGLYQFWGFYEFKAKISSNTLIMTNEGPNHIKFADGQHIVYNYPTNRLGGMLWGDRTLNIDGKMIFEDKDNGLKAQIFFNTSRYDWYEGKIYRYDPTIPPPKKDPQKMKDIKDIRELLSNVEGSFLEYCKMDGKEVWNIHNHEPQKPIPVPNPLHSDPRYREDLIWLKRENEEYAQTWKVKLEIQQRYERALRQGKQKHHK